MLTREEIIEFKKLVLEVYGIELTDEEAQVQGSRLITLFELILKSKKKSLENAMIYQKKVVQNNG
jgi:hypothetical protein